MNEHKIEGIIGKRFKKLGGHFNDIRLEMKVDDIHDFRTETKQLRSFLRMLKCGPGNPRAGIPSKLKKLYTYMGAIRTLQLQSEYVQDLSNKLSVPAPEHYLAFLASQEQAWKKRTVVKMDRLSLKEQQRKILKALPSHFDKKHIQAFVSSINRQLHILFTLPFLYDEALHDIRKRLKDLHYNWKYIESELSLLTPAYLTHPDNVKLLTDKLGDFHDRCVALHLLESIYTRSVRDEREANTLRTIIGRVQQEKYAMKEEVIGRVQHLKKWSNGQLAVDAAGIIQKSLVEI